MQVTRFLIHDRFIHCNTFSAKHLNEEVFFISRGMLFQMTGPEYERLSLKIFRLGLGVRKFSSETDLRVVFINYAVGSSLKQVADIRRDNIFNYLVNNFRFI